MPRVQARRGGVRRFRKGKRTYGKRRSYGKRKRPDATKYPGFPRNNVQKFTYTDWYDVDLTKTGGNDEIVFRANGAHDPQHASGGHQPIGWDQWSNFYKNYTVEKAVCHFTVAQPAITQANMGVLCTLILSNVANSSKVPTSVVENGNCSWACTNYMNKPITLKRTFNLKSFFDIKDTRDVAAIYGAQMGNVPTEQAYFIFQAGTLDGSTSNQPLKVFVKIDYYCRMYSPNPLTPS
nr:MAG: putative capsid protein [Arizlama virus]